jgi:putative transcriptional regulator
LTALHNSTAHDDDEPTPGVFYSTSRDAIDQLVQAPAEHLKVIIGYAGWGAGQLEKELREGSWYLLPATGELVFGDDSQMWSIAIRQVFDRFLLEALHVKHVPSNVRLN